MHVWCETVVLPAIDDDCVMCVDSVHIHTVAVLPSARGDTRPAVHDGDRHVESRLYRRRTAHRLPAVSRRKRGRTARLRHGDIWPSTRPDAAVSHQTQTFLRFV